MRPNFYNTWHYHEELELTFILKSRGTRFVGDSIQQFSTGDLVLVGENTPHVWKNNDSYYKEPVANAAEAIVIHFKKDFAGADFFNMPEMIRIRNLINDAKRGICFRGKEKNNVCKKIVALVNKNPFKQVLGLIEILNLLANVSEYYLLSSSGFIKIFFAIENDHINNVYAYIFENFRGNITLQKAAKIAHLTPTAFCRFFKSRTRKTFTQFLNEVRIGFACRLLIEGKFDIAQVCFESGFNNLSYFNRQFKIIKNDTPSSYREKYN
ncbi:MAG: AraC family transcriptional regulator [Mangrovibacterium sp.]